MTDQDQDWTPVMHGGRLAWRCCNVYLVSKLYGRWQAYYRAHRANIHTTQYDTKAEALNALWAMLNEAEKQPRPAPPTEELEDPSGS